jgi:hypothetical protein
MSTDHVPRPLRVEDVFTTSGVPTHTFVQPVEFDRLKVALRTPGRGVLVEGPAGVGKTTAVHRALLEIAGPAVRIVDDAHRRGDLADVLARLARDTAVKTAVIGVNGEGTSLVERVPGLAASIDVIRIGAQPRERIETLVRRGCAALGIEIAAHDRIVAESGGSFRLAQTLCLEACVTSGHTESHDGPYPIDASFEEITRQVLHGQENRFGTVLRGFARGLTFRPHGRAPFLHVLRWLIDSPDRSISLRDEIRRHPTEKPSVGEMIESGQLRTVTQRSDVAELLRFDPVRCTLSVEDPLLAFYLRNLDWTAFVQRVGFARVDYEHAYDVALSFAGEDRELAESLVAELRELGHAVFYDRSEQHEILANNVEDYLRPVYESGSRFVVVLLGPQYGARRWTRFEASSYHTRIELGHVIPVRSNSVSAETFDRMRDIGSLVYNPKYSLWPQAKHIAAVISQRLTNG